jgi:magnesium chelatase family protein
LGSGIHDCSCTIGNIVNYRSRVSGPLLDRIDIHVDVPALKHNELSAIHAGEPSDKIRGRVNRARETQLRRFKAQAGIYCNAHMESRQIREYCKISTEGENILKMAVQKLGLSARAYDRVLKLARTIADMESCADILPPHLCEAIQYRSLDRARMG